MIGTEMVKSTTTNAIYQCDGWLESIFFVSCVKERLCSTS